MSPVRYGLEAGETRVEDRRRGSMKVALELSYDGTDFNGWQAQAPDKARRTIQGTLEAALATITSAPRVAVVAAGRTDAGVHATGQVVSCTLPRARELPELQRALNSVLPSDVRVLRAARVASDFSARADAVSKVYRYALDTGRVQLPLRRRYAAHIPVALDHAAVFRAAALFTGTHDFASLASAGGSVKTTVRTIRRSEAWFEGDAMIYEVAADGFLRKMVRSLVGGLVAVGRGSLDVDHLRAALRARERRRWPPPAEARGLTLVQVVYEPPLIWG